MSEEIATTCKNLCSTCRVLNQVQSIVTPPTFPGTLNDIYNDSRKRVFSDMAEDAMETALLELRNATTTETTEICLNLNKACAHLSQAETICMEIPVHLISNSAPAQVSKRACLLNELFTTAIDKAKEEIKHTAADTKESLNA